MPVEGQQGANQEKARPQVQQVAGQAQEKGRQAAGQAQEKAQEAAGQAKATLREQVDQRSTQAGERVTSNVEDLRSVGEELRRQGKDKPADYTDKLAEKAERLGSYLKESDPDRILSDVEDFGRRQPWAVAAGGVALGFVASRFLKASSTQRYQQREGAGQLPASTGPRSTTGQRAGDGVGNVGPGTPAAGVRAEGRP